MADIGSIPLSKIQSLTGPNYLTWSLKLGAILKSKKLYREVIECEEPPESNDPSSAEGKVRQIWEDKNNEAFGLIILTLADDLAGLFINETKAKSVWKELEKMYTGNIEDQRIDVGLELKNIRMREKERVDDYINRARSITTKSARLGQSISERELVYYVVRGLSMKFEKVASVLRTQRGITLEELHQALREEEVRLFSQRSSIAQINTEKAYKAKEPPVNRNWRQVKETRKCYVCRKDGHIAQDCWFRQGPSDQAKLRCPKVGYQSKRQENKSLNRRSSENALHTFEVEDIAPQAYWNIDSGSTSHMTSKREWMENVKPCTVEVKLAEEGRKIKAEARGDIRLAVRGNNNELRNICIQDVLYVPNLRGNLLSVKSLVEKGNKVIFQQEDTRIIGTDGQILARPIDVNKMYVLETFPRDANAFNIKEDKEEIKVIKRNTDADSKELWHRRLGHINEDYLDQLQRHEMVRGIRFRSEKLQQCEDCIMGKLIQDPFSSVSYDKITEPLELLHMDLCGPMPVPSLGGAKYILAIVDTYSRRLFTYFLITKDEAYEYFLVFMNRVENELNKKVKAVRTDNGKEFLNQQFEELFRQRGIKHQKTTTYTPQSNGIVERMNRTIIDKTRTMLLDAGLPLQFWAEAVATATYVKNRNPFKNGGNETPMEKWTQVKPNVSHLKVFGAMAYYYVPKACRTKVEPKAKKGIFVGYSETRKAYRIYDPEINKVVETRTAKFNEGKKGAEMLNMNENDKEWVMSFEWGKLQQKSEDRDFDQADIDNVPSGTEYQTCEGVTDSLLQMEESVPNSYEEAITSSFRNEWRDSMDREIQSLNEHRVWNLVDPETVDAKILKSKWIYSIKRNPDGSVRRKSRLVAVGCGQRPGEDYLESFSPVIRTESFRVLIAIAAQMQLKVRLFDVKTAYLYGELEETIFMQQPDGYIDPESPDKICHLQKSIYGLPQSGHCWNKKLNEALEAIGLKGTEADPCIYSYTKNEQGKLLFLGVYVDDIVVVGSDDDMIEKVVNDLRAYFVITGTSLKDSQQSFLNIEIKQAGEKYELSQRGYIEKILKRYGMESCNSVKTPGDSRQDLDNYHDSPPLPDKRPYQEMIGSLMYLSVGTRPDITYCVARLSQYSKDPRTMHLTAVKRVYRYLQGTKNYKLVFDKQSGPTIEGSADASWDSTRDAKSFTGYVVKLGKSLISWKSQKQGLVALSTCESELIAINECVREVKWTVGLLEELQMTEFCKAPIIMKTDSKAAISLIDKGVTCRTKHINRKFFYVKDEVKNGNIKTEFLRSEDMEADVLTKALTFEKHNNCVNKLGLEEN